MKDVYNALVAANIGQADTIPDSCPTINLTDLDDVFILHGFFSDDDDDHEYDCGEEIGRAADSGRPERRNAPQVDAFLAIDAEFPPNTTAPISVTVLVRFPDNPELNYSYESVVQDGLLYVEPPPPRTLATVTISAHTDKVNSLNPLIITNVDFWDPVGEPGSSVILEHTFEMAWVTYLPVIQK